MIKYKTEITKAMSAMEVSGALGATTGPVIASTLNYVFGYEGPFIAFCNIYLYYIA